jgi:hypothetical protein
MLHTLRSAQMTQVVEEQDRWTEHVATHVTPVTRTQLFECARQEATSASTILRRALLRELARVEADHSVALFRQATSAPLRSGRFSPDFDRSRRIRRDVARRVRSKAKSREARGYGPAHRTRRRILRPMVEAGLTYCARCGERILRGEPWDLGHDDFDRSLYIGPEHRRCNRSAAGKKSAELQRCKTSREWQTVLQRAASGPLQASFTYGVSST